MSTLGSAFVAGLLGFFNGMVAVARTPLVHATWLVALGVADLVGVVWGHVFAFIGWLECRKRLRSDGLVAVGEVLVPRLAREQYTAGIWTGLWRVHTLTLAFAVVTETIFSWPGVGKLIIDSISTLDRPVMVAYLMLVSLLFITINLTVDIAYAALDPRLRARKTA